MRRLLATAVLVLATAADWISDVTDLLGLAYRTERQQRPHSEE
jgi:hypothetical protein